MSIDDWPFVGQDPRIRAALNLVARVAPTPATVLIVGETGTGKELIARLVHERSARAARPFLAVNCGAVADSLIESELFGHLKGAFTGANERRTGKFEAADCGTLFLDEITSMSAGLQAALLRVLQSGEYCPVGMAMPVRCDVRVVAAANRDPRELVPTGAFRADLFHRLNIIRIVLPPLRERRADLPLLIRYYLDRFAAQYGRDELRLDGESLHRLIAYDYPGNVRELEAILHRAVLTSDGPLLAVEPLTDPLDRPEPGDAPSGELGDFHHAKARVVERFEREYLLNALERSGGVVTTAAETVGLSERNFHLKLRKYGLTKSSVRLTAMSASA
jgi:transcriptional regulator with GAF, ATPase, and Fis domain